MKNLDLINYLKKNDGATLTPDLEPLNINKGFGVSIKGYETKSKNIFNLVALLVTYQKIAKKKKGMIGFWLDRETSIWYLDISKIFKHRKKAEKVGQKNDQTAIFDFLKCESIYLQKKN